MKNRLFFFAGYDQHIFRVPAVVRFADGSAQITPAPADYELSDRNLVNAAAASLSSLAGNYRSSLLGDARFFKVDWSPSRRNLLSARINTSRYYGDNNVYFDPSSPVTQYALSENGRENVHTETAMTSLTSTLTNRLVSHFRAQLSHDIQESTPNSYYSLTKITDVIGGFGRSLILPRRTRELKLHFAETVNFEQRRHSWKIGGDTLIEHLANFFPSQFGGEHIFDDIKVNPFTFAPQIAGLQITPLRAHDVPKYYMQNFGSALTYPDTNEYAALLQDTVRAGNHLAFTIGVRYDLQTFRTKDLVSNTVYPDSGQVPYDSNNASPRFGFAYTVGIRNRSSSAAAMGCSTHASLRSTHPKCS
jgi:outer membrane receptor protein involved in Fe transport